VPRPESHEISNGENNNNNNNNKDTMKPNTTLRNLLLPAILMSVGMSNAATTIPLSGAVADSSYDVWLPGKLINDPFVYDPGDPTIVLPDQATEGWHAEGAERFVVSLASAFTTAAGSETIYFDLYGRSSTNPVILARDDNYTVRLRNGETQVAEATLQGVGDTAPYFNRTTFNLGTGVTFDNIEFVNPVGDGYVAVMEVRAAYAPVPEPSAALLGGLGLLGLLRRRR
jgi:hypothetical protein